MVQLKTCGLCCGIFSTFAVLFLVVVSEVIKSGSDAIELGPQVDRNTAAEQVLVAAGIYGGCCLLSIGCFFFRRAQKQDELHHEMLDDDSSMDRSMVNLGIN